MIPTIQLDDMKKNETKILKVVRDIGRNIGVFYLDANKEKSFFDHVFEQSKFFFTLSDEQKASVDISKSGNFRGYVRQGIEETNGIVDVKESFEFAREFLVPDDDNNPSYYRMYGLNLWPSPSLLSDFQRTLEHYQDTVEEIGRSLLSCIAWSLDLSPQPNSDSGYFTGKSVHFSRLIHYNNPTFYQSDEVRLGQHTDHALFTIGIQDVRGLEVNIQGDWILLEPPEGCFVVFYGELMEFWTRGYYQSCLHRVHNQALQSARLSITTFFLPDLDALVTPISQENNKWLANADLSVSDDNVWLVSKQEGDPFQPIIVGVSEWDRLKAIFPNV